MLAVRLYLLDSNCRFCTLLDPAMFCTTIGSMNRIVHQWAEFVLPMYAYAPEFFTEMYAYNAAAAHCELPHQLIDSFTIELVIAKDEGWSLLDSTIAQGDYCIDPQTMSGPLPFAMHACQRISMGPWHFFKQNVPFDMFSSCDHPLLRVPSTVELDQYSHAFDAWSPSVLLKWTNNRERQRSAFLLCQMVRHVNAAATYYKQSHCGPSANYQETYVFSNKARQYQSELARLGVSGIRSKS
jgi:hypothetical protein